MNESNLFENYRPISALTCFSKLLEKLMYKRLYNYVEKHQILSEHQFGFRRNRSTEHAIHELLLLLLLLSLLFLFLLLLLLLLSLLLL